jgi:hypothetical protein
MLIMLWHALTSLVVGSQYIPPVFFGKFIENFITTPVFKKILLDLSKFKHI